MKLIFCNILDQGFEELEENIKPLTLLVSMKRSYIFKQIGNFQLQVYLSMMYDLLVDTRRESVKETI